MQVHPLYLISSWKLIFLLDKSFTKPTFVKLRSVRTAETCINFRLYNIELNVHVVKIAIVLAVINLNQCTIIAQTTKIITSPLQVT